MAVTELGIVSEPVKPLQPLNARSPIQVTELGIVSEPLKPLQSRNAFFPMEVTELGIVSEPVKPLQPSNAPFSMIVIFLPMVSVPVIPEQFRNAFCAIVVTLNSVPVPLRTTISGIRIALISADPLRLIIVASLVELSKSNINGKYISRSVASQAFAMELHSNKRIDTNNTFFIINVLFIWSTGQLRVQV